MISVLISIFGLMIVNRFFCRLNNLNFISDKKTKFLFWISVIPILIFQFFKDPMFVLCLYIGIFLLGLILFFVLFDKIMKNAFENSKIQFLDALILQIRVGHSPQKAVTEALFSCSDLEKKIFDPIKYVFNPNFTKDQIQFIATKHYILELKAILISSSRVVEQIQSFRDGLKIQFQFRHKSKQMTQQIKAQAIVAVLIYLMMFLISYYNLGLSEYPVLMAVSGLMFIAGLILVFKLGGNIKWKI